MNRVKDKDVRKYMNAHLPELKALIAQICEIPAPPTKEEKRAWFCQKWLEAVGAEGVYIDDALNVVYPYQCEDKAELVLFMAHSDTMDSVQEHIVIREEDGRLYGPGVGDNAANMAMLLMTVRYVLEHRLTFPVGMVFCLTSGEEWPGDLTGCRRLMADYGEKTREVIALDGTSRELINRSVGFARYRVVLHGKGGHAYSDFGTPNAVVVMSDIISELYRHKLPEGSRTTYNVAAVRGGQLISRIARRAQFVFEVRSDTLEELREVEAHFRAIIHANSSDSIRISMRLLEERPCMGEVDLQHQEELTCRCLEALQHCSETPTITMGSTDVNLPHSMGIPAVCFGTYIGSGFYHKTEWLQISSLENGFQSMIHLIDSYLS